MNSNDNLLNFDSSYTHETIRYYRCGILHCPYRSETYTRLELVKHLREFHKKITLARVAAWFMAKEQDRRREQR